MITATITIEYESKDDFYHEWGQTDADTNLVVFNKHALMRRISKTIGDDDDLTFDLLEQLIVGIASDSPLSFMEGNIVGASWTLTE